MIFAEIIAIVLITLVLGSVFYFGFRRTGPWGSFWTFLLVVFFGITMAAIWIDPVGPLWYGAAWIDFLIVGLVIALILAAATPTANEERRIYHKADVEKEEENRLAGIAVGGFFWIMIIFFFIAVAAGLLI